MQNTSLLDEVLKGIENEIQAISALDIPAKQKKFEIDLLMANKDILIAVVDSTRITEILYHASKLPVKTQMQLMIMMQHNHLMQLQQQVDHFINLMTSRRQ